MLVSVQIEDSSGTVIDPATLQMQKEIIKMLYEQLKQIPLTPEGNRVSVEVRNNVKTRVLSVSDNRIRFMNREEMWNMINTEIQKLVVENTTW